MKTQDLTKTQIGKHQTASGMIGLAVLFVASLLVASVSAQAALQHSSPNAPSDAAALQTQLSLLRDQVSELSRIIQSNGGGPPQAAVGASAAMPGMSGGGSSIGMDMMKMMSRGKMSGGSGSMPAMSTSGHDGMGMMSGMGSMPPGSGSDSGMDMGGMEMGMMRMGMEKMKMMGMMDGMKGMVMSSALPGFPGASHLYHIGATGYFLDHPEHITLSTEQQVALNRVKEQAQLNQASLGRKLAEAEQELWVLTSSDQPDAGKIEAKIREVEKLRGDQRMAFIRSVGDAAKVLTEEQRRVLTGLAEPQTGSAPAAHQHPTPPGK